MRRFPRNFGESGRREKILSGKSDRSKKCAIMVTVEAKRTARWLQKRVSASNISGKNDGTMEWITLAVLFLVVAAGFTLAGLVGFGANVLALPILSFFMPIQDLVEVFAVISFVNATYRVIENRKGIIWKDYVRIMCISLPGAVLGIWIFHTLPENWLKLVLGCFIIAMSVYNLKTKDGGTPPEENGAESFSRKLFYHGVLFTGGMLQGAFICGGPMFVIFCNHYYGYNRLHFRGMQFGIIFLNVSCVFLTYLLQGAYTGVVLTQSTVSLLALLLAFFISGKLLKKMRDRMLYVLIQIVLLCSGLSIALQAGWNLLGL